MNKFNDDEGRQLFHKTDTESALTYLRGKYICGIDFPALFYIFLAIFTSLEIDDAVVILFFTVNMASFSNANADEAEWIGMKHIILL
jgi:hypothetical protein